MPAVLVEARKNLETPPRIYTQIAIEQIDGNIKFFQTDLPAAFSAVTDKRLLEAFHDSNDRVIAALAEYKTYLETTLLPRSTGSFAYGADTYRRALAAIEMIDILRKAAREEEASAFSALTQQERHVLMLVSEGKTNREIAKSSLF
jgi:ATP/maltotriose-dependent transcriptional regulator MalT